MSRREAQRLEDALHRAAQGETVGGAMASLVETARQATRLADPVPPAPHRLAPGRQRFFAEAAKLRMDRTSRRRERAWMLGLKKLAIAATMAILVFGLLLGAGQVAADSLPGDSLYGLKLAMEEVRQLVTTDPQSRAELNLALAAERLDEVLALSQEGESVDEATVGRVQQQLEVALQTAARAGDENAAGALLRLETAIQQRQRTMAMLAQQASGEAQVRFQVLAQVMERVRQEAHAGQGSASGEQQRLRQGEPSSSEDVPGGPSVDPGTGNQQGGQQNQNGQPDAGPGPGDQPGGEQNQNGEPGAGPGPGDPSGGEQNQNGEPGAGPGPGDQSGGEQNQNGEPGAGPGPGDPSGGEQNQNGEPGAGPGPGDPSGGEQNQNGEPGAGPGPGDQSGGEQNKDGSAGAGPGPGDDSDGEKDQVGSAGAGPGPGDQSAGEQDQNGEPDPSEGPSEGPNPEPSPSPSPDPSVGPGSGAPLEKPNPDPTPAPAPEPGVGSDAPKRP